MFTLFIHVFRLGASLTVLRERIMEPEGDVTECKKVMEILIRKVPDDQEVRRLLIVGLSKCLVGRISAQNKSVQKHYADKTKG